MTTVYCPPTIYGLLPEPGPEVTDLWDATGRRYFRIPPQPPHDASWLPFDLRGLVHDEPTVNTEAFFWEELVRESGPLTATDPSQPHHFVGRLGELCQLPGCGRRPIAGVHDGTPWEQLQEATDEVPPVPDVPYLIGVQAGDGLIHAVERARAGDTGGAAGSVCGDSVIVAGRWGGFRRGSEPIDQLAHSLCPRCAWTVALAHDTTEAELAALTPSGAELAALQWLLPDPMIVPRICERILADRRAERDYDADSPRWVQLLGHVTAHRPVLLLAEDCAEESCDHHDKASGCYASAAVACPACSIQAGSWAGEWEGQYECIVPAPCAVLPAMADHVGLESPAGAGAALDALGSQYLPDPADRIAAVAEAAPDYVRPVDPHANPVPEQTPAPDPKGADR